MPRLMTLLVTPVLSVFFGFSVAGFSHASANSTAQSAPSIQPKLTPFTATYAAKFNGFSVTATRELSASKGQWQLDFTVDSLFAKIREYTRFDQKNGQLTPLHYEYHKTGLGKDRHTVLNFEPAQRRVVNVNNQRDSLDNAPANIQDKLSYQLQLALDIAAGKDTLKYTVADGKKIREYEFRLAGSEQVQTPIGTVKAIKVQRIRVDNKERATTIWFAPQWDYALVKLMQQEGKGKNYQITLTKLSINGKSISTKN